MKRPSGSIFRNKLVSNRPLKYPEDVRRALRRQWARKRSLWLAGNGRWPFVLTLGKPVQSDARLQMDAVRQWAQAWRDISAAGHVEWQERQWFDVGRQQLPARLVLKSPEEVAVWAGEDRPWRLAHERYDRLIRSWPQLSTSLSKHFNVLAGYSEQDFERLTSMLAWLERHPSSGLFPRQLPIVGLDSKWLESRKGLITELVGALCGIGSSSDFYSCCGLRPPPTLVRIMILDPALRARVGALRDLTAPLEELARLPLLPKCVFIVENIQTGLALDDLEATMVVLGRGYTVDVIGRLPWIRQATAFYWGDIDTHGFAILSRARSYLPQLESLMMNETVLQQYRDLLMEEKDQHGAEVLPNLTEEERAIYRNLKRQTWGFHLRLEQERIPWPDAWSAVKVAHSRCQ
jgi:hypothetical protein